MITKEEDDYDTFICGAIKQTTWLQNDLWHKVFIYCMHNKKKKMWKMLEIECEWKKKPIH